MIKKLSNIYINEVAPRIKKGGKFPSSTDLAFLICSNMETNFIRQWLDKVMFV